MTTVIVPINFSEASLHAAKYAGSMLQGQYGITMLLYNSYSHVSEAEEAQRKLDEVRDELRKDNFVKVETLAHYADNFMEELERVVRHKKADLLVMAITEKSSLAQVFIGSRTLKIAQTKACPVLIVPEKAEYKEVKNVMLASDFKDAANATPSMPIKDFLSIFKASLHIVNVDPEHYVSLTESFENEKKALADLFSEFNPEFYFMRLFDVDEALNLFAEERNIDLVIAIQRNHSFLEKLFKRSRTKQLSYQSKMPVLVVHE